MTHKSFLVVLSSLFAALLPAALSTHCPGQQLQQRPRYQLHSGDQVAIDYTYTPGFNETVTIQPDGFVSLKVGGDVLVAGKTLDEARVVIAERAGERLKDPVVVLSLADFQRPYFVVAGEAYAPLKYDLRENLTVLQGLMLAGGIKQTGKERQVVLIHGVGTSSQDIHVLDLKKLTSKKVFENDMALSSGDIIFIPRNKITRASQVMGLITSPATYANSAIYAAR